MKIPFSKYHGTGNDFIMIDDRALTFPTENQDLIRRLCHRRLGIGADGVIFIRDHGTLDFRMTYFNADGKEGSMCGNGGRCAAAYAFHLGLSGEEAVFEAVDGIHEAILLDRDNVRLSMQDVKEVTQGKDFFLVNTGSPHYVRFVKKLHGMDVVQAGRSVRNSREYRKEGINVNFVQENHGKLFVRTYERGVEEETWSCGTGAVAAAVCVALRINTDKTSFPVVTKGGELLVSLERNQDNVFRDIFLEGPATCVYKGTIQSEL